MKPQLSVEEIKAVAEAAITAREAVTIAKAAADAAGGTDEGLNAALGEAERTATDAEQKALALSQNPTFPLTPDKKAAKLLRRRNIINRELSQLGVDPEDEEEDEDEDLDKPVTRRELQQMEMGRARTTAQQMAEEISDPLDRAAVLASLDRVVPSGDPTKDFTEAVAIANIARNSKILEEVGRNAGATRNKPTGTGAPPRREEAFIPTTYEQMFMTKMGLKKEDILKAREKAKSK